MDKLHN